MMLRIVTWGLFLLSALFWTVGWLGAFHWGGIGRQPGDSGGILMLWAMGALFGALWLLLVFVRLIARIWHGEKARAHHA